MRRRRWYPLYKDQVKAPSRTMTIGRRLCLLPHHISLKTRLLLINRGKLHSATLLTFNSKPQRRFAMHCRSMSRLLCQGLTYSQPINRRAQSKQGYRCGYCTTHDFWCKAPPGEKDTAKACEKCSKTTNPDRDSLMAACGYARDR
jgi:hypothetical protein